MNASVDIEISIGNGLLGHRMTDGSARALRPMGKRDVAGAAALGTIFKMPPDIAELKPAGRDVAKDMLELAGIPPLTRTCKDGDRIEIAAGPLNVNLTEKELAERETKWASRETNHTSRALWKHAHQPGPALDGAVVHPDRAHENRCHADI